MVDLLGLWLGLMGSLNPSLPRIGLLFGGSANSQCENISISIYRQVCDDKFISISICDKKSAIPSPVEGRGGGVVGRWDK